MSEVMKTLEGIGIVPVIVLDDKKYALPLAKALLSGGIGAAEVTFRTSAGPDAIKEITSECPEMLVGAGTVLTVEKCKEAIASGAKFIVSPGFNREVVKYCLDNDIPVLPGCSNPSEMTEAYNLGLKVVKLFPAENLGGIEYIKSCGAAIPLRFMPTGGVNTKNLEQYAVSEKIFAVGGTWMVKKDLINMEMWDEITKICREAIATLLGFEVRHIGLNANDEGEATELSENFARVLGVKTHSTSSSKFAGNLVEVMNTKARGTHGHIAIATNKIEAAEYHMKKWGATFDESSRKVDAKGRTKLIYMNNEIGGFAIHLVQK